MLPLDLYRLLFGKGKVVKHAIDDDLREATRHDQRVSTKLGFCCLHVINSAKSVNDFVGDLAGLCAAGDVAGSQLQVEIVAYLLNFVTRAVFGSPTGTPAEAQ